jgi:hypothetical protein
MSSSTSTILHDLAKHVQTTLRVADRKFFAACANSNESREPRTGGIHDLDLRDSPSRRVTHLDRERLAIRPRKENCE